MLGGRALLTGRKPAEETATVDDAAPPVGWSPPPGQDAPKAVQLGEIELDTDENTWNVSQRLPHRASYDAVKAALPGLSELSAVDASSLSVATLDVEIVGYPFTLELEFKDRALYDVTYVYESESRDEPAGAVVDAIREYWGSRYGEPLRESYVENDGTRIDLYRWIGGSLIVDLVRTASAASTTLVVSVDSQ